MLKRISLPIQLMIVVGFVLFCGDFLSVELISFFYSVSLLLRQLLALALPFVVFFFISAGIISLRRNAPFVLSILLTIIIFSNVLAALVAYFVAGSLVKILTFGVQFDALATARDLVPWSFIALIKHYLGMLAEIFSHIPIISWFVPISSERAMISAVLLGLVVSMLSSINHHSLPAIINKFLKKLEHGIFWGKRILERGLIHWFIPILPLFIFGFLLEMNYKQIMWGLFEYYGRTFGLILVLQICYLFLMYFIANWGSIRSTINAIKNMLPSYVTAFSTMSSTATIPVSVEGSVRNTHNRPLVEMAMPILANVHLIGDAISTPILSIVTVYLFFDVTVGWATYMTFVFYFCQTMLAVSGIPGGGIIVMIPVLESVLNFNPKMVSLITTLYLLQDSFGTAANVMGDGALVMIVNHVTSWFQHKKSNS